jgi:polysaccharide pyruvyl transferase WcaK-like protein
VRPEDTTLRIAYYGLFGVGNLGNEGTLDAIVSEVRRAEPDTDMVVLGWNPQETLQRHGLPGRQFTLLPRVTWTGPLGVLAKLAARAVDIPRTLLLVGRTDAVVVPGMGVLEEQIGTRPWGLPYWLAVLSWATRLRRRPLALVNVGADEVTNPWTRRLFRRTVDGAAYCTYRDEYSRSCVADFGVQRSPGPVLPDLAFALQPPAPAPRREGTVALGVMTYYGPRDDATTGWHVHERYLASMTAAIETLLTQGQSVRMVIGDRVDTATARALQERVAQRLPDLADRVSIADVPDMSSLMSEVAACDALVASRFHNVVAGILTGRPTVSVGYGPKNAEVMRSMGLEEYCQDLVDLDADLLVKQLADVQSQWPGLGPDVRSRVDAAGGQVRTQLGALLHTLRAANGARGRRRRTGRTSPPGTIAETRRTNVAYRTFGRRAAATRERD